MGTCLKVSAVNCLGMIVSLRLTYALRSQKRRNNLSLSAEDRIMESSWLGERNADKWDR